VPLTRALALVLALVALIPFLPLAWFTWSAYHAEVAEVEREIQDSNRHIAELASAYLGLFVRQVDQEGLLVARVDPVVLPAPRTGVRWELVAADGAVTASSLDPARVGASCRYGEALASGAGDASSVSPVARWVEGAAPTALMVRPLGPARGFLVALLDVEELHRELRSWSPGSLDRHLYVVDSSGALLLYSDLELSRRGANLRTNPPIHLFLGGGDGPIRFTSTVSGKPRLGFVRRLPGPGWGVVVSADVGSRVLAARDRAVALACSIVFALATAVAILLWTSRRLVTPLLDIGRALGAARREASRPLPVRPSTRRFAEYDALVRAFDGLNAEVAEVERELVSAERASVLGQLASGLAHEMGTPLNVITGNAQYLLRKSAPDSPSRPVLQQIVSQAERIAAMIRRLLDLSRPTPPQLAPVELGAVVERALEMVPRLRRNVDVRLAVDPGLPLVLADPKLLEHALLNLVVNACQAMPDGGALTISATVDGAADDRTVELRIADTGVGIPAENLGRVFEPFFTTKPPDQGTGLGLAIVERIARQHGGAVAVSSRVGDGSAFTMTLRPAPEQRPARPPEERP
jgi:signal transduction histidine kinase